MQDFDKWTFEEEETSSGQMFSVYNQDGTRITEPYLSASSCRLISAAPQLLASCQAMMKYMEDGFLVRNTNDDHKSDWALKALSFVADMNAMHTAIAKANLPKDETTK